MSDIKNIKNDAKIFNKLINKLYFGDIIHCLLVLNDIKPSYLTRTITKNDIVIVKKYFGFKIKFIKQIGVLISKNKIPDNINNYKYIDFKKMLGYLCTNETTQNMFKCTIELIYNNIIVNVYDDVCQENNVAKFKNYAEMISKYITKLNNRISNDVTKKIIYIMTTEPIYTIADIIIAFKEHHDIKSKNNCVEYDNNRILRNRLWNIFLNYGYNLLRSLDRDKKIDILDEKYYDDILDILNDCSNDDHEKISRSVSKSYKFKKVMSIVEKYNINIDDDDYDDYDYD